MARRRLPEGSVAVVTGASGGIGLEFSKVFAEMGCRVVMAAIDRENLEAEAAAIAKTYGVETFPVTIDLCLPDAPSMLMDFIDSRGLDPDVLVNNAGIFAFRPIEEMAPGRLEAFIDLHMRAVTLLSRLFAERFAKKRRGYILNMSSMSCWAPMPGLAMYAATKAYIRVFSRSLHYEMRDCGVGVTVACPGGIATDLFGLPQNLKRLAVRIGALDTPQRFARKAVKKMLRRKMQYVNGPVNRLAIVAVGAAPTPVRMLVKRLMLDKGIRR